MWRVRGEYAANMRRVCGKYAASKRGVCGKYAGSMRPVFWQYLVSIQLVCGEYATEATNMRPLYGHTQALRGQKRPVRALYAASFRQYATSMWPVRGQ